MATASGRENRYLLIENGIDRDGCVDLINKHGLAIPLKSGCWFCPFQRKGQWRKLRMEHPELFCKAKELERLENESREERGKIPFYTFGEKRPLDTLINEAQMVLPGMDEYPPCQCGL